MNFLELAKKRCSVRQYADTPIEKEKLDYVFEAVRMAPSAVNFQPWKFLIVTTDDGLKKVQSCYGRDWIKTAPICMIACSDHRASWKRGSDGKDHADIDIAIAVEHLCLAAAEQGLGTCWVCNFDTVRCRELFQIPDYLEPAVMIPMGYPASASIFEENNKKRKELNEIIQQY